MNALLNESQAGARNCKIKLLPQAAGTKRSARCPAGGGPLIATIGGLRLVDRVQAAC